jgi:L-amino acid N-acyltransferase
MIRQATTVDLPAITAIYNHAIVYGIATFDTEPKNIEDREQWFNEHGERYPILVMLEQDEVIGWASLTKWSNKAAYDLSAEISIYFTPEHQGKGYGNQLLKAILEAGKTAGLHTIIARITEGNQASIHLHHKYGFVSVGTLKEVGNKFNRFIDVHLMQLML